MLPTAQFLTYPHIHAQGKAASRRQVRAYPITSAEAPRSQFFANKINRLASQDALREGTDYCGLIGLAGLFA